MLLELGVDHELVTLEFPPRVRNRGYLSINPLGTVPCLVDDDLVMTESAAICQYLADRFQPNTLSVGQSEPDYPQYLDWIHRSETTLTFPQTIYLRYSALEPEPRRNSQVAEDYRKWFLSRVRYLDSHLRNRTYLCSERFTTADVCVGFALHLAMTIPVVDSFSEEISRYLDRLRSRPAFVQAVAD